MNTGTWEWLPIGRAPKDRPILVIGGKLCFGPDDKYDKWPCIEPVKVMLDETCDKWVLTEMVYHLRWVENPTHFCELPTPPEVE